jgi:serine/threonine-protein kinase
VPKGSVISQKPKQGTNGFRGDTVTITVSLGPELVDVPNVVGKRTAEATKILEDRGFDVKVNKYLDGFFDSVRFQDAKAGTQLPKGSTISLTVF